MTHFVTENCFNNNFNAHVEMIIIFPNERLIYTLSSSDPIKANSSGIAKSKTFNCGQDVRNVSR